MKYLATALAVLALALASYAVVKPAPHQGVSSCAQLVHDQVKGLVETRGLKYVKDSLWACRQDGDKSVARVTVWFDQIMWDPWAQTFSPVRQHVVLVFHFTKTDWQATSWKVASETR